MERKTLIEALFLANKRNLEYAEEVINLKNQVKIYKNLFLTKLNEGVKNDGKTIMDFNSDLSNVNHQHNLAGNLMKPKEQDLFKWAINKEVKEKINAYQTSRRESRTII